MITGFTEVIPSVQVFHTDYDPTDFLEKFVQESDRDWSYVPFFKASWASEYCKSSFANLNSLITAPTLLPQLKDLQSGLFDLNDIVEQSLHGYKLSFDLFWKKDSGARLIRLNGNQFSTELEVPDNGYNTIASMALSDMRIRLDRHDIEFDVITGDVILMPCLFPFKLHVKPANDEAFLFTKHLWPKS